MKKLLILWTVLLTIMLPAAARAQNNAGKLSALEVDLWPEYDNPAMLVIYRLTLSSSFTLPADLSIRIPTEAGKPSAVAIRQVDGTLINIAYDPPQVEGDWSIIKFKATMPEVQIEYYDPRLTKDGKARHFAYTWAGDYAVDTVNIQVQQPIGATNMLITPSLSSPVIGKDGLSYYNAQIGSIAAGQTIQLTLDYQKSSDTLSAENLQVKPSAPISDGTATLTRIINFLPWLLGILGLLIIAGGGYWYWRSGRREEAPVRRPRGRSRSTFNRAAAQEDALKPPAETGNIYCHQCGRRASPSDRFCRGCGERLRVE